MAGTAEDRNRQKYFKTSNAAIYLDVSISFLQKNMGSIFLEGTHYFTANNDARLIRWDIEALDAWMRGSVTTDPDATLVNNLMKGL